jgi:hypothetical protein
MTLHLRETGCENGRSMAGLSISSVEASSFTARIRGNKIC